MNSLMSYHWGPELGNTKSSLNFYKQNDLPGVCTFLTLGTYLKSKALLSLCNTFKKEGAK